MIKKTLAAAGVAALLLLGGAASATASTYPPSVTEDTIVAGSPITVPFTGFGEATSVTFSVTGPAAVTFSSVAFAAAPVVSTKVEEVVNGAASVTFATTTPGEYVVTNNLTDAVATITVTPASTGGGTPGLPPTGSEVPTTALWLGIGAVGLGGIAVTAAVARRRAASNN